MSVDALKLEIIDWVLKVNDITVLEEILAYKKSMSSQQAAARTFGGGKHIFTNISDDFDEPLDDFHQYEQ